METVSAKVMGFTAEEWIAIGTIILALGTFILVIVGVIQLFAIRRENLCQRTLRACDAYDHDPVMHASHARLDQARRNGDLMRNPADYRHDVVTILNYMDGIAIGIERGVYDENMARAYMEFLVNHHVGQYLRASSPKCGVNSANFVVLLTLCKRWEGTFPKPPRRKRSWMEV